MLGEKKNPSSLSIEKYPSLFHQTLHSDDNPSLKYTHII